MKITVNGKLEPHELEYYIEYMKEKLKGSTIYELTLDVDGDYVNISYTANNVPFQRIRRITGYLVGDLSRFNDAKLQEVKDRVKHM